MSSLAQTLKTRKYHIQHLNRSYRIIIHFKAEEKDEKDFKISWKEVETEVRKNFKKLKIVYSRADPTEGDLALSSNKVNDKQLAGLEKAKMTI